MIPLLFSLTLLTPEIEAVKIDIPPKIDGMIEPLWRRGDSATHFTQIEPREGEPATEKTTVYLLYDDNNLYIAFRCYDKEPKRMVYWVEPRDHASGEQILIILSPFRDRITGYGFTVNAKGVEGDIYISHDGRVRDADWDGVWYARARVTDNGYNIEMKIPFKTIRFDPEINEWGINFLRVIGHKQEWVAWAPLKRSEGIRVSRSGILKGIEVRRRGLHLEFYPVGFIRYDKFEEEKFSYNAGADLDWSWTAKSYLSLTFNPDFAQVEADPYKVNLSKYETHFPEKRPFFTQGAEYFRSQEEFFYSRRIGKRLPDGQTVPILAGSKFTGRFGRYEIGVLEVYCPSVRYLYHLYPDTLVEPKSLYSVLRIDRRILKYSDIGLLYAAKDWERGYQRVFNISGVYRKRNLEVSLVGAGVLNTDTAPGYYGNFRTEWQGRNWNIYGGYLNIDDDFEISQIGYVPWKGTENLDIGCGYTFYEKGVFRALSLGGWGYTGKEYTDPGYEHGFGFSLSPYFRNNWYLSFKLNRYHSYDEMDTLWYNSFYINPSLMSDRTKPLTVSVEGKYYTLLYNYWRGWLAPQGSITVTLGWTPNPSLSLNLSIYDIIEFDEDKKIFAHDIILEPRFSYALRRDMFLSSYMHLISMVDKDFVSLSDRTKKFSPFDINSYDGARIGILLSWNFLPKSWVYIAFNQEYSKREKRTELTTQTIVFKIKYLFFM